MRLPHSPALPFCLPLRVWVSIGLMAPCWLGCQTTAPIHTWQPPRIASAGSAGVVLMGLQGPEAITGPLTEELLAAVGPDRPASIRQRVAGELAVVSPMALQPGSEIQLVSTFSQPPSDMAVAAAARKHGIPYLLRGDVVQSTGRDDSDQRLAVSWRLTPIGGGGDPIGMPTYVDEAMIQREYPELVAIPDPKARLRQATILETCRLIAATVDRETVTLAQPRLLPASRAIRRANQLAEQGNWPAAEKAWLAILDKHPRHPAAWINSAIAAAARQDFVTAKHRATEGIRWSAVSPPNAKLAQSTLVWIELRQRDYQHAFGLPDPPGGYRVLQ